MNGSATRAAHSQTTAPNTAGNTNKLTAARAGVANSMPGAGAVRPSSDGPSMASSHTRWDTGSSKTHTVNSPVATSGTTNNAATAVTTNPERTGPVQSTLQFKASALRPPIIAWLAITAFALAINLAMHNLLWAWYSFTGLLISAALAFLGHLLGWEVPDRLLWWVGVPLGLHYLGGSLSGLHSYGSNGLYYVFPWWDNVVHFLGSAAIAVVAAHLLLPGSSKARATVMAAFAAITLGVAVELYEFVHFVWLGTVDQGYYTNTMLDLYYNGLGASVAAWAYVRAGPTTD